MTQQDTSNQDLLADKDDDAQHEDEDEGGDEDEDDAVERLPKPAPWIDAPTCPAWGPMESFYDQGVLEEQVMFMCGGVSGIGIVIQFYSHQRGVGILKVRGGGRFS